MNTYRIINPNNRVIDLKEVKTEKDAIAWLIEVQKDRKDSFLEIQAKVGRNWMTLTPPRRVKSGKRATTNGL